MRNHPKNRRTRNKQHLFKIIKWPAIFICGIILFNWGHAAATAQRGYEAIGGEFILLLLPLYWRMIEESIKEVITEYADMSKMW